MPRDYVRFLLHPPTIFSLRSPSPLHFRRALTNPTVRCRYNGTENFNKTRTQVFLKSYGGVSRGSAAPWCSYIKSAPVGPPAAVYTKEFKGLTMALRADTFTMQWLNVSGANYSFVPGVTAGSALPLSHFFGDITLRIREQPQEGAGSDGDTAPPSSPSPWTFFSSVWGPFSATAKPVASKDPNVVAAHDISSLVSATSLDSNPKDFKFPLKIVRSYSKPTTAVAGGGVVMSFEITNVGAAPVELGGFGMSTPSAQAADAHMGLDHGWVQMSRTFVDQRTIVVTPLNKDSKLESWRPIMDFGGSGYEWTVHTAAWAEEWVETKQFPNLYMTGPLNATGFWPNPKSPWPSLKGSETVDPKVINITADTHWYASISCCHAVGCICSRAAREQRMFGVVLLRTIAARA